MKTLHLIESGGLYGAEKILLDLVAAQTRCGDDATVLSVGPNGSGEKAIEFAARERGIVVKPWRMAPGLNLLGMRNIFAWARVQGFDVFHSHGYRFDTLFAFADPFGGFAKVSTVHGVTLTSSGSIRTPQRLGLACLRRMDRAVFVSKKLQATYGQHLKNACVIANGVELQPIQEVRARTTSVVEQEGTIEIVSVGRLEYEKNYSLLLDAVHELVRREVPCKLTLLGEGRLLDDLQQQKERLGLSNVHFAGYSNDVLGALHASDVLVFTSTSEGMPVTVIEAMLLGVPIVSTAVGGIPEMVQGYPLAKLTEHHRPASIADRIVEACLTEPSRRASHENIQLMEKRYSSERMAREYRDVYVQVRRGST